MTIELIFITRDGGRTGGRQRSVLQETLDGRAGGRSTATGLTASQSRPRPTSKGRDENCFLVRDDHLSGRIRLDGDESDQGYQLRLQSIRCRCWEAAAGVGDAGDGGDGDVAKEEADASVALQTRPTTWENL